MNNNFLQASLLSLGAAAGVGLLWLATVYFLGREFGIIAVGVGVAAGKTFDYQMKKSEEYQEGSMSYGIAALIATAVVLIGVKYGIWYFLINESGYAFSSFLIDEVKTMDRDAFLTILFYGISLYSAYTSATRQEEEKADSDQENNESSEIPNKQ